MSIAILHHALILGAARIIAAGQEPRLSIASPVLALAFFWDICAIVAMLNYIFE